MKMTPEELNKWIKGIPVQQVDDKNITEAAGLDKDDCLDRTYPGVSDEE